MSRFIPETDLAPESYTRVRLSGFLSSSLIGYPGFRIHRLFRWGMEIAVTY